MLLADRAVYCAGYIQKLQSKLHSPGVVRDGVLSELKTFEGFQQAFWPIRPEVHGSMRLKEQIDVAVLR